MPVNMGRISQGELFPERAGVQGAKSPFGLTGTALNTSKTAESVATALFAKGDFSAVIKEFQGKIAEISTPPKAQTPAKTNQAAVKALMPNSQAARSKVLEELKDTLARRVGSEAPPVAEKVDQVATKSLSETEAAPKEEKGVGKQKRGLKARLSKIIKEIKAEGKELRGSARELAGRIEKQGEAVLSHVKSEKNGRLEKLREGLDRDIQSNMEKLKSANEELGRFPDQGSQDYKDAKRTVENLEERLGKLNALKDKIGKSPSEFKKALSSEKVNEAVKDAGNIVLDSLNKTPDQAGVVTKGLRELTDALPGADSKAREAFSGACDRLDQEVRKVVADEQERVMSEMANPGARTLFEMYRFEGGRLEQRSSFDATSLIRPMMGEVSGMTAVRLPELCERFEKEMIRGDLLKGIYGEENGLPKYPIGGGSFNGDQKAQIEHYFSVRANDAELGSSLAKAYITLSEMYNSRGSDPKSYVQAATDFVNHYKSLPH